MKIIPNISANPHLAPLAVEYLQALLQGRRNNALQMINELINHGMPVDEIYLSIMQPVMYEVGRLWQVNEISIGTEHYCTASTQLIMAQIFPHVVNPKRVNKGMVACCQGSELHELGMRMVCDFFEMAGWDTYFMGANTPGESVVAAVKSFPTDLLCISSTMGTGLPLTRSLIRDVKIALGDEPPKIMVGGLPFLMNPKLADVVGADATAVDARAAVQQAMLLLAA